MAHELGRELITVSGHEDLTSADLVGRFLLKGGETTWVDGPLTRAVRLAPDLRPEVRARLESRAAPIGRGLAAAAIRELWEETGLRLGAPGRESFLGQGLSPNAEPLDFFFRAIPPPGRPRRFDARFFLCDAGALAGDPDDFSAAGDELSHLHWLPLGRARELDMPFITQVVLSELQARLIEPDPSRPVPFFDHTESYSRYHAL